MRCRLVRAYDEVGLFDKAVTAYLDVLDRMPAAVTALQPKKMPAAGSTFLPIADAAVDAFLASRRGTPVGVAVADWRLTWPGMAGRTPVTATSPTEATARRTMGELAVVEGLVAGGRFEDALAGLVVV